MKAMGRITTNSGTVRAPSLQRANPDGSAREDHDTHVSASTIPDRASPSFSTTKPCLAFNLISRLTKFNDKKPTPYTGRRSPDWLAYPTFIDSDTLRNDEK